MQGDNTSWPWAPPFLPQNPGRLFSVGAARQLPCVWERGLLSSPRRPHVWVWQNENSINSSTKCLVFPTTFWLNILGRGKHNPLVGSQCLPPILAFWEAFFPPDPNPLHLLPPPNQLLEWDEQDEGHWNGNTVYVSTKLHHATSSFTAAATRGRQKSKISRHVEDTHTKRANSCFLL